MKKLFCVLVVLVAVPVWARRVELTIIHTTDLHGRVLPGMDYAGRQEVGGVLKVATVIREIRASRPNNVLVDCGDLYQGGAESYLTDGRLMMKVCEELRYDAWCLGNHEFDWGLEKLAALHDSTKLVMLGANIGVRQGGVNRLQKVQPFVVKELDGVRLAIIGLITPGVPNWSRPHLLGDQVFLQSVDALQRIMPAVREAKPDIILLATHQGLRPFDDHAKQIHAIVKGFPEIQFIVGGHSHRKVTGDYVGQTLFTQSGYHGTGVGQLDIAYDTEKRAVISAVPVIHDVPASVKADERLEQVCAPELARVRKYLGEKVGVSEDRIDARAEADGRSGMQMLLCRAISAASGAEIVLHGTLNEEGLAADEVTMADIWQVVPYENTIGILQLTSEEIARVLDEGAGKSGTHSLGVFGLSFDWEKGADGKKHAVRLRDASGKALHGRKRFSVAMNSYNLASGGMRYPVVRALADQPECRLEMTGVDTRAALVDYVKKNSPLKMRAIMGETK